MWRKMVHAKESDRIYQLERCRAAALGGVGARSVCFSSRHSHSSMDVSCGHSQVPWEASWIIVSATGPMTGMTTPTNFPSEAQVKAFRVDLRCSGKSMKSQLCSVDRVNWLKPVTAQGALQRARRIGRQRHTCVQGGASSLGCGVTILTARTRALASRLGNVHVFKGLDGFNVFGYFYVRLYWTGFGFQQYSVEEYVLLSASLHISVGLERTWDQKLSLGLMSGQLNLAITGLMLLTVIITLLFLFRVADTALRSPPTLINWHPSWLITLEVLVD